MDSTPSTVALDEFEWAYLACALKHAPADENSNQFLWDLQSNKVLRQDLTVYHLPDEIRLAAKLSCEEFRRWRADEMRHAYDDEYYGPSDAGADFWRSSNELRDEGFKRKLMDYNSSAFAMLSFTAIEYGAFALSLSDGTVRLQADRLTIHKEDFERLSSFQRAGLISGLEHLRITSSGDPIARHLIGVKTAMFEDLMVTYGPLLAAKVGKPAFDSAEDDPQGQARDDAAPLPTHEEVVHRLQSLDQFGEFSRRLLEQSEALCPWVTTTNLQKSTLRVEQALEQAERLSMLARFEEGKHLIRLYRQAQLELSSPARTATHTGARP